MRLLGIILILDVQKWCLIRHHYITKSTRPSGFFSCTLKNMGRPGYEAMFVLYNLTSFIQGVVWGEPELVHVCSY